MLPKASVTPGYRQEFVEKDRLDFPELTVLDALRKAKDLALAHARSLACFAGDPPLLEM